MRGLPNKISYCALGLALALCTHMALSLGGCSFRPPAGEEGGESSPDFAESSRQEIGAETGGESEGRVLREEELSWNFEDESAGRFCREALGEAEQLWYDDINRILSHMGRAQELSREGLAAGLDEGSIDRIFQCVMADHPEYFYVDGYQYTRYISLGRTVKIELSGTYNISLEEAVKRQQEIREGAEALLADLPPESGDYEKVLYIYETVIRRTEYDQSAPDNQNIYSVLAEGASVCQGYAKAVQYLLNGLGVECTLVLGQVDGGEGHAWNLVKADGEYYYVDATWGDASYQIGGQVSPAYVPPEINYDYLCVTTDQLLRTHVLENPVPLPECTATEDNYYVREGCFFSSCDTDQLARVFDRAIGQGRRDVTVKCSDGEVYGQLRQKLIDEQEVFTFFRQESGQVAYAENEKQLSMTFWMTN